MTGSDVLLTVAELAVAFAGFASIVVVFQHGRPSSWPPAVPVRLQAMVESSLGTLYATLFPFGLHALGVTGPTLWAISSAAAGVTLIAVGLLFYLRARPHLPEGELKPAFTFGLAGANVLVVGLQVVNALGIGMEPSFGPFLVATLFSLVVASLVFLRMVVPPR